jgi:molybdenum cofactor cytidylyltransferase
LSGVAGIVLAAGASRRLGEAKQMVRLGDETLLQRAVRVADEAGLKPIFVVVSGEQAVEFGVTLLAHCSALLNEGAQEGMASSIRVGVAKAIEIGVKGIVVLACDQPAVTAAHLRELFVTDERVMASSYAGRRGVPAYFPAHVFPELMELQGDAGARSLLQEAQCVELANGELDVDTAEDLERARGLFGK